MLCAGSWLAGLMPTRGTTGARRPFMRAARPWWGEKPELVSILLAAGANRKARDRAGRTPRDLAVDAGFAATADLLAA